MTALKLVVFDVDGTLIDSQDSIMATMERAFGGMGVELPAREQVLSIVGLSLDQAVARLLPDLDQAAIAKVVEHYRASFLSLRKEAGGEPTAPLYSGAQQALAALHAIDHVLLGIATGKARRGLDHETEAHGIDHFFSTRQTADQHPSKPHPSMLLAALAETGVEAAVAVMVGDTTYDIEMGRAAGYKTVGVTWGYHSAEALQAAGADRLIDDFAALGPVLDEIWGQQA